MRLNKFLASCGLASRRKCDDIISAGGVTVNGKAVKELGLQVDANKDKVEYNGKILTLPSEFVYIKLNKPKGFLCTSSDDRKRKTVFDIVKMDNVRLFCVGRLDYDTEGLLLLTNDGDFAERIIHPSFDIEKEYHATIEGNIKENELAVLRKGAVCDGVKLPAAKVKVIGIEKNDKGVRTKISVKIHEGLNRQVRRMFEAIDKNVILLKRVAIGNLTLGGLDRGKYRELTEREKECIGLYIY